MILPSSFFFAARDGRSIRNGLVNSRPSACPCHNSRRAVRSLRSIRRRRRAEDRSAARRRHRARSRARKRQSHESRGREGRARHRMAGPADRPRGPRAARPHDAGVHGERARENRRLDLRPDRPRRLSAQRSDVDHAAAAQALRALREREAGQVVRERQIAAQGRRHRLPARSDRRHAVFGHGRRGRRASSGRTTTSRSRARDHAQRLEPRRARRFRDRAHAQAQESDRRAQGAGVSARVRHVRGGVPQSREGISRRRLTTKRSSTASR